MMELINPNYVKAKDFQVETIDRSTLSYREGSKEVLLEREAGYDPKHYTAIYLSSINEWTTPLAEKIDDTKKLNIAANLKIAFELMDTRLKIE